MIFYQTSILAGPLVIIIWVIDIYLILAAIRLILGRLSSTQNSRLCQTLKIFTDPIPEALANHISERKSDSPPYWQPWAIVMVIGIVTRYLLLWLIVSHF